MTVTIEIPDNLGILFVPDGQDPSRAVLEAIALEGYRSDRLSESEIRQLLGIDTRAEVHAFLKHHGAYVHYTLEDLEHDLDAARRITHRARTDSAGGAAKRLAS